MSNNSTVVLQTLLLGELMGMVGQGIRAVAGLKKLSDDAQSKGVSSQDLFITSRLVFSLLVGFIAGIIAAISIGLNKLIDIDLGNLSTLFGIAAAGYAGTDFIEAMAPTIVGAAGKAATPSPPAPAEAITPAGGPPPPTLSRPPAGSPTDRSCLVVFTAPILTIRVYRAQFEPIILAL